MLWLLDSLLLATLSVELQPFSFRWHHHSYRHVDITERVCLGNHNSRSGDFIPCVHFCSPKLGNLSVTSASCHRWYNPIHIPKQIHKSGLRAETQCEVFTRGKIMLPTPFYLSKGSPGRVSKVKSIPSYTSSACGLRQISPGSDSQRGGMDGRAHLKSFEYTKELKQIRWSLWWKWLLQVLRIKQRMIKTDSCQEEGGRRTSVPNSQDCD